MTCEYLDQYNCLKNGGKCVGYIKNERGERIDEMTIRRMECFENSFLEGVLLQEQLRTCSE